MTRFDTIADLTNPECLRKITGPVMKVDIVPFAAIGFSGATLQRVEVLCETGTKRNFVLKLVHLKNDWISQRTNDHIGREGALLDEQCLAGIWDHIHCPYIAFARENDLTGLLMNDFSNYLFPDAREPINIAHEDIVADALASVHATFWDSPAIRKISWLTTPYEYLNILSPGEHEQDKYCPPSDKIRDSILEGWKIALQLLPAKIKSYLLQPIEEIFKPWNDLPLTLLHGDVKIANMAIIPGDKLVLFDWPMVGCAPCAMELGWYLAVNATRLARTKESFIVKYRSCLESHLQFEIDEQTWQRMIHLAVVTGAMMLLWNKALGWQSGTQKGKDEWEWWSDQLKAAVVNE
ncbi:MAG TPA: phosphotransferase [Parafilimonas sp.]|nr:phosphotransferase [Parafilimonas sp.]